MNVALYRLDGRQYTLLWLHEYTVKLPSALATLALACYVAFIGRFTMHPHSRVVAPTAATSNKDVAVRRTFGRRNLVKSLSQTLFNYSPFIDIIFRHARTSSLPASLIILIILRLDFKK